VSGPGIDRVMTLDELKADEAIGLRPADFPDS
jgi:hypothetical protein